MVKISEGFAEVYSEDLPETEETEFLHKFFPTYARRWKRMTTIGQYNVSGPLRFENLTS